MTTLTQTPVAAAPAAAAAVPTRWRTLLSHFLVPVASTLLLVLGFATERLGAPAWIWLTAYFLCYVVAGVEPFLAGARQILRISLDIDFLMVVAALGAAVIGALPEGGLLLVLFAWGHALEEHALGQARDAIKALGKLTPTTARLRRDGGEREVPVEELAVGDQIVVRPSERIPADGEILEGSSSVDESPITGESAAVAKDPGGKVFAGTLNGDGGLVVSVRKLASESTMARMARLVAEAALQKAPAERLTERFTRIYVPLVVVVTILMAVLPPQFGWLTGRDAFFRAITLLVGASPCALAISTPAAILAAVARAARSGVLVKGGMSLERLGSVKAIAMDKTGTITRGQPTVTDVVPLGGFDEATTMRLAASVEDLSPHPLARAVVAAAAQRGQQPLPALSPEQRPGKGIAATVDGKRVVVGSAKAFDGVYAPRPTAPALEALQRLEGDARTVALVCIDGQFAAALGLFDQPRSEAKAAFAALRKLGIQAVVMLTGDNRGVAELVGREVGVDEIHAGLLPERKIELIRELDRRYGCVAMVGDGVNDAPALAAASVGIAMGAGGTDVAIEAADVALMNDDLNKLAFAIGLSRATRRIIWQNVSIAMGVVLTLVVLAAFGLVPMPVAVVMHEGSTVVVVLNALRLLRRGAA
jgi:Cd2+/Zn2+-exporting ATPase